MYEEKEKKITYFDNVGLDGLKQLSTLLIRIFTSS